MVFLSAEDGLMINGSFAYLLGQYRFEFKNFGGWHGYGSANPSSIGQDLHQNPLYVVKSGHIRSTLVAESGVLSELGCSEWLWSKTAGVDQQEAYYLQVVSNENVYPTVYDLKLWGFSLW